MKTKETMMRQKLDVWAIPLTPYERDLMPDREPFHFQVRTDACWHTGAVKVHQAEVDITVPGGIDIAAKAIDTLNEAKKKLKAETAASVAEIDKMIEGLLCIEHKPFDDGDVL